MTCRIILSMWIPMLSILLMSIPALIYISLSAAWEDSRFGDGRYLRSILVEVYALQCAHPGDWALSQRHAWPVSFSLERLAMAERVHGYHQYQELRAVQLCSGCLRSHHAGTSSKRAGSWKCFMVRNLRELAVDGLYLKLPNLRTTEMKHELPLRVPDPVSTSWGITFVALDLLAVYQARGISVIAPLS